MEIYKSDYKTTHYNESTKVMINRWTEAEMNSTIFQQEILAWVELVEKYHPKGMVANTKKFTYLITVDQQDWTNNVVFPRLIAAGMRRFAIIVNEDIMTQLALEQTMEEVAPDTFQSKFFDDEEKAIQWATI